jgi:probable phosphoglycerate mutase
MLLVRHGQSEWNALGRWQGRADPPLTNVGRRQAEKAADHLSGFDAVVASPLCRALETATILAEALGIGPVLADTDLMEREAGPWQGLTRAEIEKDWPGFLRDGRRPDGYEADSALFGRARAALDRIADRFDGSTVLVVTHAGVIYALEGSCGQPVVRVPNLGGRWFGLIDGELRLGPRVEVVPDGGLPELM